MPNKFQIKRTTTTGRTPNTTNVANTTYIAAGELALNMTDGKLFSSDGTNLITVGSNLSSISVSGNGIFAQINATSILVGANVTLSTTSLNIGNATVNSVLTSSTINVGSFSANTTAVNLTANLAINGTVGTNGQVVSMNGTSLSYTSLPPTIAIYDVSNTVLANAYFITGSSINQLSDVDTVTVAPLNGQTLIWNSANSQWYPGNTTNDPIVLNDISSYFDNSTMVFPLKTNQTDFTTIVDSKDVDVVINGLKLSPYINSISYPWITPYDAFNGFRVVSSNLIIYSAPAAGSTASIIYRNFSSAKQTRRYPFSATTITLGD